MLRDQLRGQERPKAVEVECPEFPDADGAPAKLLFRSRLTVSDVIALGEFESPFAPMRFELLLFHLLALDENGERLVDPDADEVYPRECGGTNRQRRKSRKAGGLSPRVRGNQVMGLVDWSRFGSIPASAGEPKGESGAAGADGVYPRECGGTGRHRSRRLMR